MKSNKETLWRVVFKADTTAGKAFDIGLIFCILLSVTVVMLESVHEIRQRFGQELFFAEIFFTFLFTLELVLRLYVVRNKTRYIVSFFGMVDIISILPLYLIFFFPSFASFGIVRVLRLLRIFRVLKLERYLIAGDSLTQAFFESLPKIIVFLCTTLSIVSIMGGIMFIVEGPENGFTSIPKAVYWAIVTLTTVGYGDIVPQTLFGKFISSILMITGYGIIAVPTGLVSAEIVHRKMRGRGKICTKCNAFNQNEDAHFCGQCGHKFEFL